MDRWGVTPRSRRVGAVRAPTLTAVRRAYREECTTIAVAAPPDNRCMSMIAANAPSQLEFLDSSSRASCLPTCLRAPFRGSFLACMCSLVECAP